MASPHTYFTNYRFPVVSTRAANVYGPGQQLYRIIPRTIVAAMGGQKLRLDGGGTSVRVFIHMTDVSNATLRIAQKGTLGDTYHISSDRLISTAASCAPNSAGRTRFRWKMESMIWSVGPNASRTS